MHRERGGGIMPWEIRRMTIPEIMLALDGDFEHRGASAGAILGTTTEEHRIRWQSLTPREKIEELRKDW